MSDVVDNNVEDTGADDATANEEVEIISMSKDDFDKKIQGAEDRVRNKYSKKIKELEAKLPAEKTAAELEMESKLSKLEQKQLELEEREKEVAFRAQLQELKLDSGMADFIRPDADLKAFGEFFEGVINSRLRAGGYVPQNHENNTSITKAEWDKMTYSEMVALSESNPNLVAGFLR